MRRRQFLAVILGTLATGRAALAAGKAPPKPITIKVNDMHCGSCAKKIARKLYAVPGVVKVQTDLAKHTAVVTPQTDAPPDPKLLWKAVESAGFQPLLLTGDGYTLKAKPGAPKVAVQPHGPEETR